MNKSIISYFYSTIFFTILSIVIGYVWLGGFGAIYTIIILIILEVSLSVDNAVVNAKILQNWGEKWKRRFLTWGMLIAVFGMRLFFPIIIVAIAIGTSPVDVLYIAIETPEKYSESLKSVHSEVMAFGGFFLLMVALSFFFDKNKEEHWIIFIEKGFNKMKVVDNIEKIIPLIIILLLYLFIDEASVIISGISGIVLFLLINSLSSFIDNDNGSNKVVMKEGIVSFIYLEVLDASFSFDGVIGSFAITNNIFIIMLGLGVGAFAVRAITIMLVDKGTIQEFKYLEHGAFWAILALSIIMIISTFSHSIPEWLTGIIGIVFILAALKSSVKHNKKEKNDKIE